jgi:hypothetical protein
MSPQELVKAREFGSQLQGLASNLSEVLNNMTGEKVGFVLTMHCLGTSQYVSNCARPDGTRMMEEILMRWRANRADMGAQMNPALAQPLNKAVMVYPDRAEHFTNVCKAAADKLYKADPLLADELRKLRDTLKGN